MQFITLAAVIATMVSSTVAANPILMKRCEFLSKSLLDSIIKGYSNALTECLAAAAPAIASCGGAIASDGASESTSSFFYPTSGLILYTDPWLDASCLTSVFNDLENIVSFLVRYFSLA